MTFSHNSDDNGKHILIVDSELDLLNMMQRVFLMHGFRLCIFTDGLAALKHFSLNSKAHRIVISDIRLPDMTRNEFVRQIWKSNPKVRLILIGDEGSPDSNADTFLKKPFSLEKLRNIVQEYYQQEKEL